MLNIIIALSIFSGTFYFIISGKLDRTIAALAGAVIMVIAGVTRGFYSQEMAFNAVDFDTLLLLMGMMIIISVLRDSGFFTFVAIKAIKTSSGNPWKIMAILGLTTAFMSMILDNVTTVLLICPVTILICDMLALSPLPVLLSEVLLSNIGGVATLVGDPPNVIISSAANFSFNDFLINLFPKIIFIMIVSLFVLKRLFSKYLQRSPKNVEAIMKIDEKKAIKNSSVMYKCTFVLIVVWILFLIHTKIHFSPAFIAILGAGLILVLVRPKPEEILRHIEWNMLLFFACLFVVVGGVKETGFMAIIGEQIATIAKTNMLVANISLLWIAGILSSIMDNVPFTVVMIPVLKHIALLGIDVNSLWWTLALGVGLGGNGTPIGSAAGVVCLSMSDKTKEPIDFKSWLKSGTIIAVLSLVIISIVIIFIL